MDSILTIGIILIFVVLLILAYAVLTSNTKIHENKYKEPNLFKFSANVTYEPYPTTIDIQNQFDCNATSLHVCDINDPTTLFGCKELVVRCHHFETDTPYINNNVTTTIPKNAAPNEGYALAITTLADACNPYHGDFTLITTDATSNEYMMICNCKNPGYIGNENLLDNCTNVFICNGKIDNIDQPLSKINCQCSASEKSIRYDDGLPVCKELLVIEANELYTDWSNLVNFTSDRQLATKNFNYTISQNINSSRLLDPCRNSLHDPTIEIPNASYNSVYGECNFRDYGFPISNGMLLFKPSTAGTIPEVSVDCGLATGKYLKIRFADSIGGIRRIYAIVVDDIKFNEDYSETQMALVPANGITFNNQSSIYVTPKYHSFYAPKCEGSWPTYSCSIEDYYGFETSGLYFPGSRPCPSSFLWSQEDWTDCEYMIIEGLQIQKRGLTIDNARFFRVKPLLSYGVQWVAKESTEQTGITVFQNQGDFDRHKNVVT